MAERQLKSTAPVFLVDDVAASSAYYRDVLGFRFDRLWGEPPSFSMPERDGVVIMLKQTVPPGAARPNHTLISEIWDAYIWVRDLDALLAELRDRGANVTRGPEDMLYGCREIDVEDCNGYRLCFGQTPE